MLVTHLECSLTGERYEPGQALGLSRAGKPLLCLRFERARRTMSREALAARKNRRCGNGPNCYRCRMASSRLALAKPETPTRPRCRTPPHGRRFNLLVKDEGRLPTGIVQGARAVRWRCPWRGISGSGEWPCRPTAMPARRSRLTVRGRGLRRCVICPAETPEINVRETAPMARASMSRTARSTSAGGWSARAQRGSLVRLSRRSRSLPARGQKAMGFELAEQLGWNCPT